MGETGAAGVPPPADRSGALAEGSPRGRADRAAAAVLGFAENDRRERTVSETIPPTVDELRRTLLERDRQIDALATMGRAITSTLDLGAIAKTVYTQLRQILPEEKLRTFFLAVTNPEKRVHEFILSYEDGVQEPPDELPFGEVGITNWAVKNDQDLFILDGTEAWEKRMGVRGVGAEVGSLILVLVKREGRTIGVLSIQSAHETNAYTEDHRRLLRIIADQAAVAIDNARLFRELRESAISRHLVGELVRDFSRQLRNATVALYLTGAEFRRASPAASRSTSRGSGSRGSGSSPSSWSTRTRAGPSSRGAISSRRSSRGRFPRITSPPVS